VFALLMIFGAPSPPRRVPATWRGWVGGGGCLRFCPRLGQPSFADSPHPTPDRLPTPAAFRGRKNIELDARNGKNYNEHEKLAQETAQALGGFTAISPDGLVTGDQSDLG